MAVAAEALPSVTPSLDEVRALAAEHTLIPLRHSFIDDCETPVSAFLKLRGDEPAFLLESAERGQAVGRWSFIGARPRKVLRWSLADGGDPYALAAEE
ncbi:MAG TPA: anthranilate synthase component I, partial [Solirubrobacteraceae bacterium]